MKKNSSKTSVINNNSNYIEKRCTDIVLFFNKYYKTKLKYNECIDNKKLINNIIIKTPFNDQQNIEIKDFQNLQILFTFIFNTLLKININKNHSKKSFEILWIILDIFNQSFLNYKKKSKDIGPILKIFTDVVNFIKFGNYIFIIKDLNYKFTFNVKGYDYAKLDLTKI